MAGGDNLDILLNRSKVRKQREKKDKKISDTFSLRCSPYTRRVLSSSPFRNLGAYDKGKMDASDEYSASPGPENGRGKALAVEDMTLEHLGYQPELHRRFGLLDMVGSVSIVLCVWLNLTLRRLVLAGVL